MNARTKVVKSGSGTHPAVIAHRRKMDSINETTMPALEALNERLDRAIEKAQVEDDREDAQRRDDREDVPESVEAPSSREVAKP